MSSFKGNGSRDLSGIIVAVVIVLILGGIIAVFFLIPGSEVEDRDTITLYGFSVKGEVFDERIIPGFKDYWKEKTDKEVHFETSYAGSGKITNQVISGAPAEVMILSTELDALQLKEKKCVTTDWRDFPFNGTVSKSPWVILTRKGNPHDITGFSDLARKDIDIVHADPLTSGGARWSIFSVYGSQLMTSETEEGFRNYSLANDTLEGMIQNVISWQSSARKALSQFSLGYGDVLITYENDALLSLKKGEDFEIVYPSSTIFSEHKVVIVDENVEEDERVLMEEFVDFLYTEKAQIHLVNYGFRSVSDDLNENNSMFPRIKNGFTVDYLGGWEKAFTDIIEGVFREYRGERK